MDINIYKVIINHFRGYRKRKEFDLENGLDIVILAGSNGFGKTSLFDAIEWGFTGELSRFAEPNEEKNNSCFINYQPFETNGKVSIEFGNDEDRYILTRESTYSIGDNTDYSNRKTTMQIRGNNIEDLCDDDAIVFLNNIMIKKEWRNRIQFSDIFSQYHVLTQDKIKKFIQGLKAPDRYKQIAMMVGTQKFYDYKNSYERKCKDIRDKIKKIANDKNEKKIKIESMKKLEDDNIEINMGNHASLEQWVESLVEEYNNNSKIIEKQRYVINEETKLIDVIKELSSYIFEAKEYVIGEKINKENTKEQMTSLKYRLDNYLRYKTEIQIYRNLIPIVEKGHKLIKLQNQLPSYKEYKTHMRDIQQKLLEGNNRLKQMQIYLLKFNELCSKLESVLSEINIKDDRTQTLGENLKKQMSFLKDSVFDCEDADKIIVNGGFVQFLDYREEIELNLDQPINLNELIRTSIQQYTKNLNEMLPTILEEEGKQDSLIEKLKILESEVEDLSSLDKELKSILSESSRYIKAVKEDLNKKINCPLCDSPYNKDILLDKIEKKLVSDSYSLSIKLGTKKDIEIQLEKIQETISNVKNQYISIKEDFISQMKTINNAIVSLKQLIKKQEEIYNEQQKMLEEEKLKLKENQSNIIAQIDEMNLSENPDNLEQELLTEIKFINKKLQEKGFDLATSQTDDMTDKVSTYNHIIKNFEKELEDFKINKNKPKEDIDTKINEITQKHETLNKISKNLTALEHKVGDVHKVLINSKRRKEIDRLEEEYENLCSKEEKYNISAQTLEQIISASTEAIQEISESILAQHEYFINSIYKKINPHPLFNKIEFIFDKNSRGNDILNINCVNDKIDNKVNPAFAFSSAQVNVVAVSIFLGVALRQECSNLKTILLDDPIQNMDDLNVISFIDILRNCLTTQNKKQIIISTHDQDFFRLMLKKFRFTNNKAFEFLSYDNNGPVIRD